MNINPSSNPSEQPELAAINERVMASVKAHQRRIFLLTLGTFVFGFLAITASIAIVGGYFVLYRPKQMQMMRDFSMQSRDAAQMQPPQPGPDPTSPRVRYDFPHIQTVMTHALSFGTMLVAVAVGLLALGTLVMLALIVSQRRATLHQINTSLAQIAGQLRELRESQGRGA